LPLPLPLPLPIAGWEAEEDVLPMVFVDGK